MLQKPILSGRIGKWAYALTEYDLAYESLRAMKGQVIADFIVDHRIKVKKILIMLAYAHGNFILMDRFVVRDKASAMF